MKHDIAVLRLNPSGHAKICLACKQLLWGSPGHNLTDDDVLVLAEFAIALRERGREKGEA